MCNDLKKYYQSQFGTFDSISAKEISELNNYELQLLELPGMFFHREKNSMPELKKALQKILTISKN